MPLTTGSFGDQQQQQVKKTRYVKTVTGANNNGSGLIQLTVTAHGFSTGQWVNVASVAGTTEANGHWQVTGVSANTLDLQGSTFANAYVSGGTVTRESTP